MHNYENFVSWEPFHLIYLDGHLYNPRAESLSLQQRKLISVIVHQPINVPRFIFLSLYEILNVAAWEQRGGRNIIVCSFSSCHKQGRANMRAHVPVINKLTASIAATTWQNALCSGTARSKGACGRLMSHNLFLPQAQDVETTCGVHVCWFAGFLASWLVCLWIVLVAGDSYEENYFNLVFTFNRYHYY